MWFIIFGLLVVVGLIYYYLTSNYRFFEKRGVPGPKPKFPFGNMPSWVTQKQSVTFDYDDIYQEFRGKAPFVGYFEARSPSILLIDPETIKCVLVKNFTNFHDNTFSQMCDKESEPIFGRNPFMLRGEEWKEKRAEITPAFTPSRIKALFPLVDDVLGRFTKYINDELAKKTDEPFDAREICAKYTTDVVSSCIFNADAQSFTKDKPEIREMGRKIMQPTTFMNFMFLLYTFFPFTMKLYKIRMVSQEIQDFFVSIMQQAVDNRKKHKTNSDDYLSYLISLRERKNFSDLDMAAHGVTFFMDGFDTSSLAIAYTLFELADNKQSQEKLRDEIKYIFDAQGKIIYDKLIDHPFLDQVFHETLRLHPIGTVTNRECTEDIELEGVKGKIYKMKKGESVMIPIYSIHRDPDYYSQPDMFIPERFDAEHGGLKAFKDRGVYLSFGDGPRMCLGMRFALMQSKAAVAEIVRNFDISVSTKTQVPLVIDPKEYINVKTGGVWLDFKPVVTA